MNLMKKLSLLKTSLTISIKASPVVKKQLEVFVHQRINPRVEYVPNAPFSIISLEESGVFETFIAQENDEALYTVSIRVISELYQKFPKLYISFENAMKVFIEEHSVEPSMIRFVYADVLKAVIRKEVNHFSFDGASEAFRIDPTLVRCAWPWYNLYIRGNTLEWCCGYKHTDEKERWDEKTGVLDIAKEWSSKPFQRVRHILKTEDTKGNCSSCHNLYFEQFFPYVYDFMALNKEQSDNLDAILYHYWLKNEVVDAFPARYEMIVGYQCNLKCIMCNQEEYNKLTYVLPTSVIMDNKHLFQKAIDISLLGGEFFALKNAKEILDIFSSPDFEDVRFLFITNGTLIHRYFDQLKNIKKMIISFSLDTIGENYEAIRKGAKWEKVEENIVAFMRLYEEEKAKNPSLHWQIQSPAIIMKKSIGSLYAYVQWCVAHDITPAFIKLEPYGVSIDDEDVFRHKELLEEIEDWKGIFEQSLNLLRSKGWHHSFNTLKQIFQQLQ